MLLRAVEGVNPEGATVIFMKMSVTMRWDKQRL
jgi:hypothetical protein